jgi:hypothetical protein
MIYDPRVLGQNVNARGTGVVELSAVGENLIDPPVSRIFDLKLQYAWRVSHTVPTSGLLVYIDAGNIISYPGTGTTVFDLSGNGTNGTLVNSPSYSATTNGGVWTFNGSNNYISVPVNISATNYTVIASARYDGGANRRRSISSGGTNWLMGHYASKPLAYYVSDSGGWIQVSGGTGTFDTNWRIYAGTKSSTTFQLYSNNVLGLSGTAANGTGPNGIVLGGDTIYSEFSNCQIGFLLVYNRALTATEMTQVYDTFKGRYSLT